MKINWKVRGSPPRVRGTAILHDYNSLCPGITPACAGNSNFTHLCTRFPWDHPRVCGEQASKSVSKRLLIGSPPRVRGTALRCAGVQVDVGITPACAGNRTTWKDENGNTWDHPRVCGEQPIHLPLTNKYLGSPPRVRGTGSVIPFFLNPSRITPACAGNSLLRRPQGAAI